MNPWTGGFTSGTVVFFGPLLVAVMMGLFVGAIWLLQRLGNLLRITSFGPSDLIIHPDPAAFVTNASKNVSNTLKRLSAGDYGLLALLIWMGWGSTTLVSTFAQSNLPQWLQEEAWWLQLIAGGGFIFFFMNILVSVLFLWWSILHVLAGEPRRDAAKRLAEYLNRL